MKWSFAFILICVFLAVCGSLESTHAASKAITAERQSKEFPSLNDAVAQIGSSQTALIISTAEFPVTANVAIPSSLTLKFNYPGTLAIGKFTVTGLKEARPEWFGAKGDGRTNDTLAIQAAVNAAPKIIIRNGSYIINATRMTPMPGATCGILVPDHREIIMEDSAILSTLPNNADNYAIFHAHDVANISIKGGVLIGERSAHILSGGGDDQHGFGVDFRGVTQGRISGTIAKNFNGDGFYLGAGAAGAFCDDIVIDGVVSDNNVRQGLSIVGANNVKVLRSKFSNTHGHVPQAGIDIETNDPAIAQHSILIEGNTFVNNSGSAVDILRGQNVRVLNNNMTGNRGGHVIAGNAGGASSSNIIISGNHYISNKYNGIEFGDNIDNIFFTDNEVRHLTTIANGIFHYGESPTTPAHITVKNNTLTADTKDGYFMSWSIEDTLSDWDVSGNIIYLSGGVRGIEWRGRNVDFHDNKVYVGSGGLTGTNAITFIGSGKARIHGNSFFNSSGAPHPITSINQEIELGSDNVFSRDIYPSGIKQER